MISRLSRRRRRRFSDDAYVKGTYLLHDVNADPNVLPPSAAITARRTYCVEDGCRNEATSSRLIETFAPVVVNGTEVDQTVELVCEDHT
jgi:hypothetical protein